MLQHLLLEQRVSANDASRQSLRREGSAGAERVGAQTGWEEVLCRVCFWSKRSEAPPLAGAGEGIDSTTLWVSFILRAGCDRLEVRGIGRQVFLRLLRRAESTAKLRIFSGTHAMLRIGVREVAPIHW